MIIALAIVLSAVAAQTVIRFTDPVPNARVSGVMGTVTETLRSNLTESDLLLMPFAGAPIPLAEGKVILTRDNVIEEIPLLAIKNRTKDGAMWRAGEEICFAGTSPGCLRPAAGRVDAMIIVQNQLLFKADYFLRAFSILPSGGITASCSGPAQLYVVGADITYGANGPQIPVRLNWTTNNGTTQTPLFGLQPIKTGMTYTQEISRGAVIGVRGNANYANFHASYRSWVSDPHIRVLKDGDAAPNVPAFGNQTSVEVFLQPYVDTATRTMTLSFNEAILLFEFNPSLNSPAADYQDAVTLVKFPTGGCKV